MIYVLIVLLAWILCGCLSILIEVVSQYIESRKAFVPLNDAIEMFVSGPFGLMAMVAFVMVPFLIFVTKRLARFLFIGSEKLKKKYGDKPFIDLH